METRNVIWIASYPKSGNTWVASVLEVAGRAVGGYPQGGHDIYVLRKEGKQPAICAAVDDRFRSRPCSVLKTHAPWPPTSPAHRFEGLELQSAGYIHIYRNPLDVLLSYINFTRIEYEPHRDDPNYRRQIFAELLGYRVAPSYEDWLSTRLEDIPQANLDHALHAFSEAGMGLARVTGMSGTWSDHTASWRDAGSVPGLSVRYEDCLVDPRQITKLAQFFSFTENDAAQALAFVNSRTSTASAMGGQSQRLFYNKMAAYYFHNYFSGSAITRFCAAHESDLRAAGYDVIVEAPLTC